MLLPKGWAIIATLYAHFVLLIQAGLDNRSLSFIPEVESMLTAAKALPKSKPVTGSEKTLCICDIGGECLIVLNLTIASE